MISMEYKGLWEDGEAKKGTIYKVIEFYDWHNCDPEIDTTIFEGLQNAESFFKERVKEISREVFDEENVEWSGEEIKRENMKIEKRWDGGICINDDNDYVNLSLQEDTIHPLVFD